MVVRAALWPIWFFTQMMTSWEFPERRRPAHVNPSDSPCNGIYSNDHPNRFTAYPNSWEIAPLLLFGVVRRWKFTYISHVEPAYNVTYHDGPRARQQSTLDQHYNTASKVEAFPIQIKISRCHWEANLIQELYSNSFQMHQNQDNALNRHSNKSNLK